MTRRLLALTALAVFTATVSGTGTTAVAAVAGQAPVSTRSMPDPGVYLDGRAFYAFTTGGFGLWEATARTAGGPWSASRNVLETSSIPGWVDKNAGVWAPDMTRLPGGEFVVYFSAVLNVNRSLREPETPASGARCIGAAVSASPTGPFRVQANPVVCLVGYGAADKMTADPGNRVHGEGVIDPDPVFIDNSWDKHTNELFLLYKTQSGSGKATIRMVRMEVSNGTSAVGVSHQLLAAIPTGAGGTHQFTDTIEAPSLLPLSNGWFVLFVAHGNFGTCGYSTEWFKSRHPWSWTQNGATTVLSQAKDGLCGPGSADVSGSEVSGQYRLFFHAYANGTAGSAREMHADVLTIGSDGYTPHLSG
jgi:hypothetical protein